MRIIISILLTLLLFSCSKGKAVDNSFTKLISSIELDYIQNKPDSALYKAHQAHFIAKTDVGMQIQALAAKALVCSYYFPNKNEKLIDSIITLSKAHKNRYYEAYAYLLQSLTYINTNTKKAFECAERSLSIAQTNNIPDMTAYALANKAELLRGDGNETMALVYAIKSKRAFDKIETQLSPIGKYFLGSLANTMGIIYKNRGEYSKSLEMYSLYSTISARIGDVYSVAISSNNIGIVNYRMKNYAQAKDFYSKAIDQFSRISKTEFLGDVYHNFYNLYNETNQKLQSDSAFILCEKMFVSASDTEGLAKLYLSRGLNELENNRLALADKYILKASTINASRSNALFRAEIANALSKINQKQGNYAEALNKYKLYRQLSDSLNNIRAALELGSVQENYRIEKQIAAEQATRESIEKAEVERIDRRNLIEYTAIALIIAIILIITLLIKRKNIKPRLIDAVMFFALLLVFNFISVLLDPLFDNWSNNEPLIQLLLNIALALIITPLDGWLEGKV